eukprot:TRINITY_DN1948_c0_g1_i1.p1 TRINITY_DN1948_c0_g1~~TRINITY_DN1948_c0_g1_i1.p1  ORF type:complete len:286 (+),score=52.21 TRINITY_DN1948_c0_g1_i1:614-1471(+)
MSLVPLVCSPATWRIINQEPTRHFYTHLILCGILLLCPCIYRFTKATSQQMAVVVSISIFFVHALDVYFLGYFSAAIVSGFITISFVAFMLVGKWFGVLCVMMVSASTIIIAHMTKSLDARDRWDGDDLNIYGMICFLSTTLTISLSGLYYARRLIPTNNKVYTLFHPPKNSALQRAQSSTALSVAANFDPIQMLVSERGEDWIYEETDDAYVAFLKPDHRLQYARLLSVEDDRLYLAWLEQEQDSPLFRLEGTTSLEHIRCVVCLVHMRPYKEDLYILLHNAIH